MKIRPWTFGQKIGAGFVIAVTLSLLISIFSIYTLNLIIKVKDIVALDYAQEVIEAETTHSLIEALVASSRAVILTGDLKFAERMRATRIKLNSQVKLLNQLVTSHRGKLLLKRIVDSAGEYSSMVDKTTGLLKTHGVNSSVVIQFFEGKLLANRDQLEANISNLIDYKRQLLKQEKEISTHASQNARKLLILISSLSVLLMSSIAIFLSKSLTKLYRQSQLETRSREDIIAIVSHDLKNPLSAILLAAKFLLRKDSIKQDETSYKFVKNIERSGEHMNRLIYDLLDLARLEAGQFQIEKKIYKTKELIDEVLEIFEPLANEKSISIQSEVLDADAPILCDKERILQVFTNLIGNSIKFTPANGKVFIRFEFNNSYSQFSISDTGPGIPKNQLPFIFERYKQAKVEDKKKGAGLGLYIAKKIIEGHGGRIWGENNADVGATFVFRLPMEIGALQ